MKSLSPRTPHPQQKQAKNAGEAVLHPRENAEF